MQKKIQYNTITLLNLHRKTKQPFTVFYLTALYKRESIQKYVITSNIDVKDAITKHIVGLNVCAIFYFTITKIL